MTIERVPEVSQPGHVKRQRAEAPSRADQLAACEEQVKRGIEEIEHGFEQLGTALRQIKDEGLYAGQYATFEEYCQERWGITRRHADRLVQGVTVKEILGPMGLKITNERQARELAPLAGDPERAQAVYLKAEQAAGGKAPTGAQIAHARDEAEPDPAGKAQKDPAGKAQKSAERITEHLVELRDSAYRTAKSISWHLTRLAAPIEADRKELILASVNQVQNVLDQIREDIGKADAA